MGLNRDHTDVCSHKHAFFLDNFIRRLFQNPKRILGAYIHPNDRVIDFGCGSGFFTLDMAEMVGPHGRVIAVDLQKEMLDKLARKIKKRSLGNRIRLHQCPPDQTGHEQGLGADFALAFYMLHEIPDPAAFLEEIMGLLAPGGRLLIVEPVFHVAAKRFEGFKRSALELGYLLEGSPRGKGGRSLLLKKPPGFPVKK